MVYRLRCCFSVYFAQITAEIFFIFLPLFSPLTAITRKTRYSCPAPPCFLRIPGIMCTLCIFLTGSERCTLFLSPARTLHTPILRTASYIFLGWCLLSISYRQSPKAPRPFLCISPKAKFLPAPLSFPPPFPDSIRPLSPVLRRQLPLHTRPIPTGRSRPSPVSPLSSHHTRWPRLGIGSLPFSIAYLILLFLSGNMAVIFFPVGLPCPRNCIHAYISRPRHMSPYIAAIRIPNRSAVFFHFFGVFRENPPGKRV